MKDVETRAARHNYPLALALALMSWAGTAQADECVQWQGSLQQGGLIWGQVAPGTQVTLDGKNLTVLPDGTTFAGFGRNAPATSQLELEVQVEVGVGSGVKVLESAPCKQTLAVAAREYRIQRVQGVPQQTVTPPPERQARIARERALVQAAKGRQIEDPKLLEDALAGFVWPAQGPISGVYGSQRYYNGTPGSPHYGVDVAVPKGHPVTAPTGGVVTLAESDLFYSGGTIILDHGYGLSSSFLHLSKVSVVVGQEVATGELMGQVGASGRATGPHLDWRMSWRGERIDPQLLVPPMPNPAVSAKP